MSARTFFPVIEDCFRFFEKQSLVCSCEVCKRTNADRMIATETARPVRVLLSQASERKSFAKTPNIDDYRFIDATGAFSLVSGLSYSVPGLGPYCFCPPLLRLFLILLFKFFLFIS